MQNDIPEHNEYHGQGYEFCPFCSAKIGPNTIKCWNCKSSIYKTRSKTVYETLIVKCRQATVKGILGSLVFIIWLAGTYAIFDSMGFGWVSIIALAIFWICFFPAYKIVRGEL